MGIHTVRTINERGPSYPFAVAVSNLQQAEIAFINLEALCTNTGTKLDRRFAFNAPTEFISGLAQVAFEATTLANYHFWDYGLDEPSNTISTLDSIDTPFAALA